MMKYNKVVGIGGIGTGLLFISGENATLGRSESRLVELSDAKDYCKLHIVFHYVAKLLRNRAHVYPIGWVGKDAHGRALVEEMEEAGMRTDYVYADGELPTMISIVLQYPDKETCNFTASNSASDKVDPDFVEKSMMTLGVNPTTIIAAIPEVQIKSRLHMLRLGKKCGAFCCLSIPQSEAGVFVEADIFTCVDLLAVNHNEALALSPGEGDERETARRLYGFLREKNPDVMLLVTCSGKGAFTAHNDRIEHVPPLPCKAVNTSGAGDACLGGVIAGLAVGLPFQKGKDDGFFGETPLGSAAELGTLCAGMSVETADSIAKYVSIESIAERIYKNGWKKDGGFFA